MQAETKTILQTTDIVAHLKAPAKPLTDIEIQQDYDYFMAQETANMLLSAGLLPAFEAFLQMRSTPAIAFFRRPTRTAISIGIRMMVSSTSIM